MLLNEIYPYVMPELPGCDTHVVDQWSVRGWRELCRRSHIYKYDLDPVAIKEDIAEYELYGQPDCTEIITVSQVMRGLHPFRERYTLGVRSSWEPFTKRTTFRLVNTPTADASEDITITVELQPTLTATEVDDELFNHYMEAVRCYVLFNLKRQTRKAYTDAQGSAINYREWQRRLSEARIDAEHDNLPDPLMARPPTPFIVTSGNASRRSTFE